MAVGCWGERDGWGQASQAEGRMPKWFWRLIITIALLIGLPFLGLGGGLALMRGCQRADAEQWEPLGVPPEMPTEIVDAGLDIVYVRGRGGSLFACDHTGATRENACWSEVEEPSTKDLDVEYGKTYSGDIPPSPGPVVQSLDVSRHHAERAWYRRYVLLEDGSVWLWDYNADANWNLMLLMGGPTCGLALAIVIILLVWLAAGLRALLRRHKAKEGT